MAIAYKGFPSIKGDVTVSNQEYKGSINRFILNLGIAGLGTITKTIFDIPAGKKLLIWSISTWGKDTNITQSRIYINDLVSGSVVDLAGMQGSGSGRFNTDISLVKPFEVLGGQELLGQVINFGGGGGSFYASLNVWLVDSNFSQI
jgi:hypothetical protein